MVDNLVMKASTLVPLHAKGGLPEEGTTGQVDEDVPPTT